MVLMNNKIIIYQVLPRLFGNRVTTRKRFGAIAENGCGKFSNFDEHTLRGIHDMGFSHIWYTGVIRHATQTDYSLYGIPSQHAEIVKGKAGSPYAITDYYDVDPDLALCVEHRMEEWLSLIERTHREGMKVIIDFVPNHVAREYHSICKPKGVRDLGEDDNPNMNFSTDNNFYYCWGMPLDLSDVDVDNVSYHESPAKATGNDRFTNRPGRNDWYETVKLNYGIDYCDAGGRSYHFDPIPDTWKKMTDILLFWAEKGVDGFRCDMAEMVPSAFWDYATKKVRKEYPHIIFIGEVYEKTFNWNHLLICMREIFEFTETQEKDLFIYDLKKRCSIYNKNLDDPLRACGNLLSILDSWKNYNEEGKSKVMTLYEKVCPHNNNYLTSTYLIGNAIDFFNRSLEMHSSGKSYKEMITTLFFLEDDLHNDSNYLNYASEVFLINAGYVSEKIKNLNKYSLEKSHLLEIDNYIRN